MFLSITDIFKVGVGPSSSHTMGPMVAAGRFVEFLAKGDWVRPAGVSVARLEARLHGSLAFTGRGHASDRAVALGVLGFEPATLDVDAAESALLAWRERETVEIEDHGTCRFGPDDIVFDYDEALPLHPNAMTMRAFDTSGNMLLRRAYYSVGGGFVREEDEMTAAAAPASADVPYPFRSGAEMVSMADASRLTIAGMKRANERAAGHDADAAADRIAAVMNDVIDRGLAAEGELPGGLHVRRRAKRLHQRLEGERHRNMPSPMRESDWLSLFAIAVNEENAAGGRVVTAPTNGAAGVVPAVLRYAQTFMPGMGREAARDYLLTAAAVGGIIKSNASISGAEVGCQGEVGSASAMAAAGMAALMGGTPRQIENAAEIALEHHLGMTCDPVAGLVQVPCIERNAFGAIKAVAAASLALHGDGEHVVSLDDCVETMRQTGRDMDERYKETSLGGLAANVSVRRVEC